MARLKVTNTKAIRSLDVDLKPGTITVLNGPNGAGKSTTLQVLQSAITKKNIGDLAPTDGERAGIVEFDGVTIKVGRRVSFSGEPEGTVCLVEGGDDILGFINPGIKDPEAADRKRLEKLCSIVGAELTEQDLREFVGLELWDDYRASRAAGEKSGGIVATVKALKRWLEEQARDLEAKIVACTTEIETIGNVPSGDTKAPDVAAMQQESDKLVVEIGDLRAKQKASKEAAEALGSIRDVLLDEESLQHDLEVTVQSLDGVATDIATLETKLVELKAERAALESTRGSLLEKIETAKKQSARLEVLQQQARDAVTDEQIADLEAKRAEKQQVITDAIVLRDRLKTAEESRQRLAVLKSQREKLEAQADRCRAKATESPNLLQKVVQGLDGWSISTDVRLCCRTERSKQEAFDDLSPGLKAIRALELSCMRPKTGSGRKVVVLPQETWESLDGSNRELVAQWTKDRDLIVLTGICRQKCKCSHCGFEQRMSNTACEACGGEISADRIVAEEYQP